MSGQLAGRTCLITGASSGLGAHFAEIVSAAGARVVLAARRKERIELLAESIRSGGGAAVAVAMDVTDPYSIEAAFAEAEQKAGAIDTLIANAGVSRTGPSVKLPVEAVREVFDTNLLGVYLTARAAAARMIASGSTEGRGRVVIIGSMLAGMTGHGDSAYSASKAAVAQLGRGFAREWVRKGINVNVIQPGYILTEMAADWFASDQGKAQIAGFPRRRLQPVASVDAMLLHLCSDAADATTGAVITIDDGQSL